MFGFRRARERGYPRSSNRASSFHLSWRFPPGTPPLVAVAVSLEVIEPPAVNDLYFWALQAGFADHGRRFGAGHLGLQWYPVHPGGTAVNWGGYAQSGGELRGSESALPSATRNVNTRDFDWRAKTPYELRIDRSEHGWRGLVNDVVVRELFADGGELVDVAMWSEVFARCDAPSVAVQWSRLRGWAADGGEHRPHQVVTNYQAVANGGCSNTNSSVVDGSVGGPVDQSGGPVFEQRTNSPRLTQTGALLTVT